MKKVFQENSTDLEYYLCENTKNEWNSFSKPLAIDANYNYSPLSSIGELIPELEEMSFDL